jgi:valyl-tRNA synthetase
VGEVEVALEQYRFDRAADVLYHFVWHEFCDWYLEMVKPDLAEEAPAERRRTARAVLLETVDVILRLLHPFVPYVTEELWQRFPKEGRYLAEGSWPRNDPARIDQRVERDMEILQELVVRIRNLRAESRIDPSRRVDVLVHAPTHRHARLVTDHADLVAGLSRASVLRIVDGFEEGLVAARGVVRGLEIALPLDGLVDLTSERERLAKDLAKIEADLASCVRKLNNDSFLERAPAEVVEKERALHRDLLERKRKIESGLAMLGRGPAG